MNLQPPIQEVQGCVLGAERGQGQPRTKTGILGEGLGCCDGDEGGSDQGRMPPGDNGILGQDGCPILSENQVSAQKQVMGQEGYCAGRTESRVGERMSLLGWGDPR